MIKCKACRAFFHFSAMSFNKFNNTGARILDSVYHVTLKLVKNHKFGIFYADL